MLVGQLVEAIHGKREQNQLYDFVLDFEEAVAELEEFVGMAACRHTISLSPTDEIACS